MVEGQIFVSPELLEEYRKVPSALTKRGKIDNRQFRDLIAGIAAVVANASLVYPKERMEICRDPADDMILKCCLEAKADLLVTGDQDLLSLRNLPFQVKIITPGNYLLLKKRKR